MATARAANNSATRFINAAKVFYERGWVAHPLRNDEKGYPKVPVTLNWSNLPHDWNIIKDQEWDNARGIGIVLGAQSGNLAVLDVDDEELFNAYVASNLCPNWYRLVRTARKRGHAYFYELDWASSSTKRNVVYQGRIIQIELKAQGNQVAAPPSPGYELLYQEPPQPIDNISDAFGFFMDCLNDFIPGQVTSDDDKPLQTRRAARSGMPSAPTYLPLVFDAIIAEIERRGLRWRPQGVGILSQCPFDTSGFMGDFSLSVHPEKGWKDFGDHGEGKLIDLAIRLGITEVGNG